MNRNNGKRPLEEYQEMARGLFSELPWIQTELVGVAQGATPTQAGKITYKRMKDLVGKDKARALADAARALANIRKWYSEEELQRSVEQLRKEVAAAERGLKNPEEVMLCSNS